MTNKEYLIAVLTGKTDECGAQEETVIHYVINCPYYCDDERSHCKDTINLTREMCVACKTEWLESEVCE